jgi:hypothetical protein
MSKIQKVIAAASAAVLGLVVSAQVYEASEFPATIAGTFTTDVGDTVGDFKDWIIGIVFVIGLAMFAINMTKKGLGKAGAR